MILPLRVADKMQELCEEVNAAGIEVTEEGYLFIFKSGNYSSVKSKTNLGFFTSSIWINLDNFAENLNTVYSRIHPDNHIDPARGHQLCKYVSDKLVRGSEQAFKLWENHGVINNPKVGDKLARTFHWQAFDVSKGKILTAQELEQKELKNNVVPVSLDPRLADIQLI